MRLLGRILFLFIITGQSACTYLLFQPMAQHLYTPEVLGIEFSELSLNVEPDIELHGWRLETRQDRIGNVLYLHGNGENISTHFTNVAWLTEHGYDVTLFDYRGYGKSSGVAELDGAMRDIEAMLEFMLQQADNVPVIVIGHSLGGAMAVYAVSAFDSKHELTALVTIEAFSDYRQITRDFLDRSWLTWALQWPLSLTIDNSYSPEDYVAEVYPVPLLIMHSRKDLAIEIDHAMRLYEHARSPKQFIEIDSDHNRVFVNPSNKRLLLEYLGGL